MPKATCHRCQKTKVIPSGENSDKENWLCGGCITSIERRINQIDRNADEEVKEGKLEVMFREIPSDAVPLEIQQMVEEVGDEDFLPEARIHKAGRIDHFTNETSKGLELKQRFAP